MGTLRATMGHVLLVVAMASTMAASTFAMPTQLKCNTTLGLKCNGYDIRDAGVVTTAQACCTLCGGEPACRHWTWNNGVDNHCWLKTACNPSPGDKRFTSGHSAPAPPAPPTPPTPPTPPAPPAQVCKSVSGLGRSENASAWLYDVSPTHHPSSSSAGGVNDLGTFPTQCQGDPTSVRIEITPGKAECLKAAVPQCKIPMRDFTSLDYKLSVGACDGVWAAPLWMTPDLWQWGGGSGEIDSVEFCPRNAAWMNFAGGGHQVPAAGGLSIDGSQAHVTVRKDLAGIVTISSCSTVDAAANNGQCAAPTYSGCADCKAATQPFACWCNEQSTPKNIYGSGGCSGGGNCMWTLVSDLWNGLRGDGGYDACMSAADGVDHGKPNMKSECAASVENVVLRGSGPNGALTFGPGSPQACSVFTV